MELIDREETFKHFCEMCDDGQRDCKGDKDCALWVWLADMPTIDAEPVVHCKDCRFWDRKQISCEGLARCATGESGVRYRTSHDYCSRGVRMDAGDDNAHAR